ncbi:MAG: hypothetical protein LUF29_08835 [Oscillospiraceae bacterium]|nr:hypothetical protein [Oscillospiraceae bacterium]
MCGGVVVDIADDTFIWIHKCTDSKESNELKDYKLFCFNGEPRLTLVCSDRFSEQGLHEDFFDNDWTHQNIARPNTPNSVIPIEKPYCFDEMLNLSRKLSKDIPFARIDFYEIQKCPYFGEITFFPASGMNGFVPDDIDVELGRKISLSI